MTSASPKTVLFLCKCGTNIAEFVDLDEVAKTFAASGGAAVIESHELLCSPDGRKFVQDVVARNKPDCVVVAACSPKTHEKTFQDAAGAAGLNMGKVSMANIREQSAWVTSNKAEATAKAISLIRAAIRRTALNEELSRDSIECNTDVAVIGGGIAGIEAALIAANAGRKVTIIERDISLGGEVIRTEEVAPTMECAPCLLAPRLSAVRDHPNIRVIANAEVTDVLGFFGNFTVKVARKARYIKDSCIGCEACFEVCPVSVKNSFLLGMGEKKAVYTQFPGSVPAAAVIDREHCKHFTDGSCSACVEACPFQAINFDDTDESVEIAAGAVVMATGSGSVDSAALAGLGHGKLDNVYTMPEFERLASSNGFTGGTLTLKDGRIPTSAVVIHCAGSLCQGGLQYCSGICCTTAVKAGDLLRKKCPGVAVTNLHDRLVFPSPQAQAFYQEQAHHGTRFVRVGDLAGVSVVRDGNALKVTAPGMAPTTVDMVILSTGMRPSQSGAHLAQLLNLDVDQWGFPRADHSILHATGSTIDGVYLAGSCASPCDVTTAITRAQAAAGDVISRLAPGRKVELEPMPSVIDADLCGGCKLCIAVCPYKAITYDAEKHVSSINEAICRGCGTCAATCPGKAATAKHFTNQQIYAEIGGILNGRV